MRAVRSRVVTKISPPVPSTPEGAAADPGFEERYALVCQAVAEGIYEWDIERNVLSPSERLIEIFGFEGNGLSAADWNGIVHPEDFPKREKDLEHFVTIAGRYRSLPSLLSDMALAGLTAGAGAWSLDRGLADRTPRSLAQN